MASKTIVIPDIGTDDLVDVIEVFVSPGDTVKKDEPVLTLEGEKASMEVPAPENGTIESVSVKVGDKVKKGDPMFVMVVTDEAEETDVDVPAEKTEAVAPAEKETAAPDAVVAKQTTAVAEKNQEPVLEAVAETESTGEMVHAGPAVRRIAREFGVNLTQIPGSGQKGRILKTDVQTFVKSRLAGGAQGGVGLAVAPMPAIDFSQFGEIETKPLTKIKRLTGEHTHRSWVTIPHVTQFDEADITELEAFRKENKAQAEAGGFKLTPLVFIMKAVVSALQAMPSFNSSLDPSGQHLILKKYYNIGVAVDTPNGLVVAVLRDVDQKGFFELAKELGEISKKAREKGLTPNEMKGGCFTISSLGGIGGTAFTPIVNQPDVAILGVSKAKMQPVYQEGAWVPRLILPLSLSYDHRVIDGAEAARFTRYLAECLQDLRRILL